ncbi:MAG: methylated-DNA--[protein]-cysteine S-methyltransferase [Acidimicrobiia bacterium]|nr:methylated-DNA--[protein]-cysteine S-methyltransferase [Acidimicrobiia bacterium]
MTDLCERSVTTPIGELRLIADAEHLRAVLWPDERPADRGFSDLRSNGGDHPVLDAAQTQLGEYFAGERRSFDLPLAPAGTPFQRQAWAALRRIPFGETRTYAEQAAAIGRPTAARAIGAANGKNPLPVVVPCHRVIGADGSLTGFAGGVDTKRFLLDLEAGGAPDSPA